MKGLTLSKKYYSEYGRILLDQFREYEQFMAAGLAGEGSECFGYDDDISQDHDFGPGFVIWLPDELYLKIGQQMQSSYDMLPKQFCGYRREELPQSSGRVGITSIERFFIKYTGRNSIPVTCLDWFKIPESYLATATNGSIFMDNYGKLTEIRNAYNAFYPEDVIKKKLAARLSAMGQSGQYNLGRCLARKDCVASYLALSEFVTAAIGALYLINRKYMPFYKWAFRGTEEFTMLYSSAEKLKKLVEGYKWANGQCENNSNEVILTMIDEICRDVEEELCRCGWLNKKGDFLMSQAEVLMKGITDQQLANLPASLDF